MAIAVSPAASPSSPSVMFTALLVPHDERDEHHVQHAEGRDDQHVLVEWQRRGRARQGAKGVLPQIPAERSPIEICPRSLYASTSPVFFFPRRLCLSLR